MRKQTAFIFCMALALLVGSASASRELLQGKLPKLDLPPITEFLPPLESTNLMPLNAFLNKTGLPSWDELGLPPISELMRPVGGPRPIMAKFPSRAEVAKLANDTITQVIQEMLPPELKALASVQLPKLAIAQQLLPGLKIPNLPSNLPPLQDLLKALPPMDASNMPNIPGLSLLKLPPPNEIMKFVETASKLLGGLPKPANMPSLQEMLSIINSISNSVGGVVAAPAATSG